jgi:hypothetical protein
MFKAIFEKMFYTSLYYGGFQEMPASFRTMLLRSNADIDPRSIDLSVKSVQSVAIKASSGSTTYHVASDINPCVK